MPSPPTKKAKISPIHMLFDHPEPTVAKCQRCNSLLKVKDGNTSTLWKHVRRLHPEDYKKALSSKSGAESLTLETWYTRKKQQNLRKKQTCSDMKASRIDEALLNIVIRDLRPFSFCSTEAFREYVNLTESTTYKPPSRKRMVRLLNEKFDKYIKELRKEINAKKTLISGSLTTDLWTSSTNDAYVGVTFHYIDKRWKIRSKALTVRHLPKDRHTAEVIANVLNEVINDFGIEVVSIIHDNGANMVKANRLVSGTEQVKDNENSEEDYIIYNHDDMNDTCMAHTLQLCIKAVLAADTIKPVIKRQIRIAKDFRKSVPFWNALRLEQNNKNKDDKKKKALRPLLFAEVRWNSVMMLLERNLELKEFYASLVTSKLDEEVSETLLQKTEKGKYPQHSDWDMIREMYKILKNFSDVTKCWSGESYVSSSLVYPILFELYKTVKQRVNKKNKSMALVADFRHALRIQLETRFKVNEPKKLLAKSFMFASALDPRFKDLKFLNNTKMADCVWFNLKLLTSAKIEELKMRGNVKLSQSSNECFTPPITSSPKDSSDKNKISALCSLVGACNSREEEVQELNSSEYDTSVEEEVKLYRRMPKLGIDGNPLEWWKNNAIKLPKLAVMAKSMLSIPASSAPCERVFSVAGNVLNKKRMSLAPDNVEKIIILHDMDEYTKYARIAKSDKQEKKEDSENGENDSSSESDNEAEEAEFEDDYVEEVMSNEEYNDGEQEEDPTLTPQQLSQDNPLDNPIYENDPPLD